MSTLGTRDRGRSRGCGGGKGWLNLDVQELAMQVQASQPLVSPIPVPRSRNGAGPTGRGWSKTLTWRGLRVWLPLHWHCSRNGHERQSRILAA